MCGNVAVNANCHQPNNDFANIISLPSGGLQILESNAGTSSTSGNTSMPSIPMSVLSTPPHHVSDQGGDKTAMRNFISTLQSSGVQVVENNTDQTLSISLPKSTSVTDKRIPLEKMYKLVDGGGNVTLITTSGNESGEKTVSDISQIPPCNTAAMYVYIFLITLK